MPQSSVFSRQGSQPQVSFDIYVYRVITNIFEITGFSGHEEKNRMFHPSCVGFMFANLAPEILFVVIITSTKHGFVKKFLSF